MNRVSVGYSSTLDMKSRIAFVPISIAASVFVFMVIFVLFVMRKNCIVPFVSEFAGLFHPVEGDTADL
ncbi:MAG: hypothetical protein ACLUDU_07325 [Butyricimonas faecihominis]